MKIIRHLTILFVLIFLWQGIIWLWQLPSYILPTPLQVIVTWIQQAPLIAAQAIPTLVEILLGLFFGILFGVMTALLMAWLKPVQIWLLPMLIISQAIPTFAIAPLLVIWLGYGMASKIVTIIIMLFFPVASNFYDGLRRTESGWLDLAQTMGGNKLRTLLYIKIPAALPNLASGIRVASTIAPIGAVVGEWVGASKGLGFLMLNANARLQIDLMFAAMFTIMLLALLLYFGVDKLTKLIVTWE